MSLDVYLTGPENQVPCACECGNQHMKSNGNTSFEYNVTHNLNKMAAEAGLYEALWRPDELGVMKAAQLIPLLTGGLEVLKADPKRFEVFNPTNGWGDYAGLVTFVERYLEACKQSPESDVGVSR